MRRPAPPFTLFPYTTLFRSLPRSPPIGIGLAALERDRFAGRAPLAMAPVHNDPDVLLSLKGRSKRPLEIGDRKSTRLNSSHTVISYAVFCLKKKMPKSATKN